MAIKASKLTAVLLSGAMIAGGAGTAFAATPAENAAPANGETPAVTAPAETTTTDPAAPAETTAVTKDNVKSITDGMLAMSEAEADAVVDNVAKNDNAGLPLLTAGIVGEIYVHPKDTPAEQEAQKKTIDKMANVANYAYKLLTDDQKANLPEIPDGYEYPGAAGADYFSTAAPIGKATKDKKQNARLTKAPTKKQEILVVSFGTSFNNSRYQTIGAIERAVEKKYKKSYSVRRAFTSQVIINHVRTRDGYWIDTVREALNKAKKAGVKKLVVQPTTLMNGEEYDLLVQNVKANTYKGLKYKVSKPLLNTSADRTKVAKALAADAVKVAKQKTSTLKKGTGVAYVFMGHGTDHKNQIRYTQMQAAYQKLGYKNVYVGTVEGKPASTSLESTIAKLKKKGYKKVVLRPMMVVAGDHANNDMAGDDADSWKTGIKNAGFKVECQIKGLGQLKSVRDIYLAHTKATIKALK